MSIPYATATPIMAYDGVDRKMSQGNLMSLPQFSPPKAMDSKQIRQLKDQGFTEGLAKSLTANSEAFPLRIWIVDNSGSMHSSDGHRLVKTSNKHDVRFVPCSRWDEIRECVGYHVNMAALLEAPTTFRLLNNPGGANSQEFSVAQSTKQEIQHDVQHAVEIMNRTRPSGVTPLTKHIEEIHKIVSDIAPEFNRKSQRVVIVIATDGLPSNEYGITGNWEQEQFLQALQLLEGLPVWVVIRLCTDEEDVVNYYNDLDEQLELSLEVLDDFVAEAAEVHEFNKWLNYSLPLHRCREMGFYDRVFDLIDERSLTKSELRDFCSILFGCDNMDGVPDPELNWKKFAQEIERLVEGEEGQWNPIKKRVVPVLNMKKLKKAYGPKRGLLGRLLGL